jgi:hypothetical protein
MTVMQSAPHARLEDLVGVDDEVLADHRQHAARAAEILPRAAEVLAVGEHRQARRVGRVRLRLRRVEVGPMSPLLTRLISAMTAASLGHAPGWPRRIPSQALRAALDSASGTPPRRFHLAALGGRIRSGCAHAPPWRSLGE